MIKLFSLIFSLLAILFLFTNCDDPEMNNSGVNPGILDVDPGPRMCTLMAGDPHLRVVLDSDINEDEFYAYSVNRDDGEFDYDECDLERDGYREINVGVGRTEMFDRDGINFYEGVNRPFIRLDWEIYRTYVDETNTVLSSDIDFKLYKKANCDSEYELVEHYDQKINWIIEQVNGPGCGPQDYIGTIEL